MRQIRRYQHSFIHPHHSGLVNIRASGSTPCQARGIAWALLESMKKENRSLPQDNEWKLYRQIDCVLLGVLEGS